MTAQASSAAINGWTVRWTLAGGQPISQVWGGTLTTSGTRATVRNAAPVDRLAHSSRLEADPADSIDQ
ncbi:cellulose binding domain-containing protein [Plantactinospora sp. CA-294935]|uniref:cellulose binding domain-containing protein n=1 Tax=Plantactinospora sp. CA-294935 TaxID=3240012 RepID=UPI003D8AF0B8